MIRPANFDDWGALRKTGMFQELFAQVQLAVAPGMERECLSHHTTASCRAHGAPLKSLKSCGIETPIPSPDRKGVYVHLDLPHSFYNNDSWGFQYYSPSCPNLKDAQKIASLEILTTLLSMQPNIVRIPDSCVADSD